MGLSIPSTGRVMEQPSTVSSNSNTLYVGGSGEGNYTKIQDAIDNASDGDTVFVYDDSSPYYENLSINKSIDLIGEENYKPIIDGGGSWHVVDIYADNVTINGFRIQSDENHGIVLHSDYNCISNNIIKNHLCGIEGFDSSYNNISHNIITGKYDGIDLSGSFNEIIGNTIISHKDYDGTGIFLQATFYNRIERNVIKYCYFGITIFCSSHNIISQNIIQNNTALGIFLAITSKTKIIENNFINNSINASFARSFPMEILIKITGIRGIQTELLKFKVLATNTWDKNYWGRPYELPYLIHGFRGFLLIGYKGFIFSLLNFLEEPSSSIFNCVAIDWHPAKEPYDIEV